MSSKPVVEGHEDPVVSADDFLRYQRWKNWHNRPFGQYGRAEGAYYAAEMKLAGVDMARAQRVLEIGFGIGGFAAWAVAHGWSYVGIEADPFLVFRAREAGYTAHGPKDGLGDDASGPAYDLIVAFDVLEHFEKDRIAPLLEKLAARLVPGGRLIARFPNGDSPFGRYYQYGDMTHRTVIGSGMIDQLARETGFRVVQVRAPALPIAGLGPRRALRRAGLLLLRSALTRLLNLAFANNEKIALTSNLVIVLDRPA